MKVSTEGNVAVVEDLKPGAVFSCDGQILLKVTVFASEGGITGYVALGGREGETPFPYLVSHDPHPKTGVADLSETLTFVPKSVGIPKEIVLRGQARTAGVIALSPKGQKRMFISNGQNLWVLDLDTAEVRHGVEFNNEIWLAGYELRKPAMENTVVVFDRT